MPVEVTRNEGNSHREHARPVTGKQHELGGEVGDEGIGDVGDPEQGEDKVI